MDDAARTNRTVAEVSVGRAGQVSGGDSELGPGDQGKIERPSRADLARGRRNAIWLGVCCTFSLGSKCKRHNLPKIDRTKCFFSTNQKLTILRLIGLKLSRQARGSESSLHVHSDKPLALELKLLFARRGHEPKEVLCHCTKLLCDSFPIMTVIGGKLCDGNRGLLRRSLLTDRLSDHGGQYSTSRIDI
jgi:hypothetical protein